MSKNKREILIKQIEKESCEKLFSTKNIEKLCRENNRNIEDFGKFMNCQTVVSVMGETMYYGCDVKMFFNKNVIKDEE